jgi:hypothetical protein
MAIRFRIIGHPHYLYQLSLARRSRDTDEGFPVLGFTRLWSTCIGEVFGIVVLSPAEA